LSKKRADIQTFFLQPLMPKFRISEHFYGNGINVAVETGCVAPGLKTTNSGFQKPANLLAAGELELWPNGMMANKTVFTPIG
jgi:hypothetical protein